MPIKKHIAVIVLFVQVPCWVRAADSIPVDQAIEILETSLSKRDRINAVAALRNAEGAAAPAIQVLARIIAQDPCGDEAGYAAEALGYIGKPSLPLIAGLIKNGFDWSYLCASHSMRRLPHGLDEALLGELEPTLKGSVTPEDRFNAILVLGSYPLKAESANRICRMLMSKRYIASGPAAALFLAPKCDDVAILDLIDAHPLKSMKYLGARVREEWRRRPILRELAKWHVPIPLSEEEKKRFAEADARLTVLAREATAEALDRLRHTSSRHEQYFWLEMLRYLAVHCPPPRDETKKGLDSITRIRGSTIDRLLIDYRNELTRKGEQSPAGDVLKAAPEE